MKSIILLCFFATAFGGNAHLIPRNAQAGLDEPPPTVARYHFTGLINGICLLYTDQEKEDFEKNFGTISKSFNCEADPQKDGEVVHVCTYSSEHLGKKARQMCKDSKAGWQG